jgi:hypothetical protein
MKSMSAVTLSSIFRMLPTTTLGSGPAARHLRG